MMCLLANLNLKAQDSAKPLEWKSYYKDDKVEISYKYADCNIPNEGISEENVYLKFVNNTENNISVQYEQEFHFGNKCYNCEGGNYEHTKRVVLKPSQTIEGTCDISTGQELKIFSKFNNMANKSVLVDFKIKNIVIKEINN